MKRYLHLVFAVLICLTLVGCRDAGQESETSAPETQAEETAEDQTMEETTAAETDPLKYYVCLDGADLGSNVKGVFDTLDEAKAAYGSVKPYLGYRIVDSNGEFVYGNYTELQCDLLREAKEITDYIRKNRFKYGDAPLNPAINHDAKTVSCDRLVCWIYYNAGFTDQPEKSGLVVSNFEAWCIEHGFEKITSVEDLQPGDLVGVFPSDNGKYPKHVFMYAGVGKINEKNPSQSTYYRYDAGSDTRIQSKQPFCEPIVDFMFAYRPVLHSGSAAKIESGKTVDMGCGYSAKLFQIISGFEWEDGEFGQPTYVFTIDGTEYALDTSSYTLQNRENGRITRIKKSERIEFRDTLKEIFK